MNVPLLTIEAVEGCNLACVGCSHGSPSDAIRFYDPKALAHDLATIALSPLVIEVVGGEPTLHPRLDAVLAVVRGFAQEATVRMVTNGSRLKRWETLPFDEVWWSRYPGQPDPDYRGPARLRVLDRSLFRVQYGTPADAAATYRSCSLAQTWRCLVLKAGRLYRCGPSIALGAEGVDPSDAAAVARLVSTQPAECAACMGTSGRTQPWSQDAPAVWAFGLGAG